MNFYHPENIAIIADLHLGVHSNSDTWHKIVLDYGKWLKTELQKRNILDIIILGDIFNDREEIGVNTLAVAEQFFKLFSDDIQPFNIILLNGNHDSFLRDTSRINSISVFRGWKNITIIDQPYIYEYDHRKHPDPNPPKKLIFLPWGCEPDSQMSANVLFGHMEINSFKMNGSNVCEKGLNSETLLKIAPLVFSGHFHIREDRNYKNGHIVYVGSPFAQNWGDRETIKGFYLLNLQNFKYEFIENTISPVYHKLKFSAFLDKTQLSNLKQQIPNNFIKIEVDVPIDITQIDKLLTALSLLKPMEISTDFTISEDTITSTSIELSNLDTKPLLLEFIETLEIPSLKDKVIQEITEIYEKAATKVNIEETP